MTGEWNQQRRFGFLRVKQATNEQKNVHVRVTLQHSPGSFFARFHRVLLADCCNFGGIPTMSADQVFTLHDVYDHAHASDGVSRYRAYLAQNARRFRYGGEKRTTDPTEFAAAAFVIASPPIMSPPYIGTHPRVLHATPHWDDTRRCAMQLELAIPLTEPIANQLPPHFAGWMRDPSSGHFYVPEDNDEPSACARLAIRIPLPRDLLPQPAYTHDGVADVDTAKRAIRAICAHGNSIHTHLITTLDTPNEDDDFPQWHAYGNAR
jgi:hypothetical protein